MVIHKLATGVLTVESVYHNLLYLLCAHYLYRICSSRRQSLEEKYYIFMILHLSVRRTVL
jgi:hypothetical protein